MAYVSVDIDMGDIDTDDLCEELLSRLRRKRIKDQDKKDLREAIKDIGFEMGVGEYSIPNKSLEDRIKIEFLSNNWNNFTSWQLEEMLKPVC